MKMRCDPIECCGKEWDAPDPEPCPRCGSIEHVGPWEAWGHPDGTLLCYECCGYNSPDPLRDGQYFTWSRAENGDLNIHAWYRVDPAQPTTSGEGEGDAVNT